MSANGQIQAEETEEMLSVRLPPRLSGSMIERFRKCRRQYLFHLTEPDRQDRGQSPQLLIGIAVHAALAVFGGISPEQRSGDQAEMLLHRCLRSVWRDHVKPSAFGSVAEERNAGESALSLLSRFVAAFDSAFVAGAREAWVGTRLPAPPGSVHGPYIYGRIDRIDLSGDGTLHLVDYKTSMAQEIDLLRDPQVQVMAIAAEAEFGREVSAIRFLFLGGEAQEVRLDPEREDIEFMRSQLIDVIEDMRNETTFPPAPHPSICRWCPFRLLCPDAGKIEPESLVIPEDLGF